MHNAKIINQLDFLSAPFIGVFFTQKHMYPRKSRHLLPKKVGHLLYGKWVRQDAHNKLKLSLPMKIGVAG